MNHLQAVFACCKLNGPTNVVEAIRCRQAVVLRSVLHVAMYGSLRCTAAAYFFAVNAQHTPRTQQLQVEPVRTGSPNLDVSLPGHTAVRRQRLAVALRKVQRSVDTVGAVRIRAQQPGLSIMAQ